MLRAALRLRPAPSRRTFASTPPAPPRALTVPNVAAAFPHRWLRDSCQCSACVHPSTRQKLHRSSDIPPDVRPVETTLSGAELRVVWAAPGAPPHESVYALDWLQTYASAEGRHAFHHDVERMLWTPAVLRAAPHLFVEYAALQRAPLPALTQLLQYGILVVTGVPTAPTDDAHCELRRLAAALGRIRPTFYGAVWDVVSVPRSTNIAYTDLALGLHMDLLYFAHPPRYQILHALRTRASGGTSLFVDAVAAAQRLPPAARAVLARTPVPFHYVNAGHHLHHAHPTLELAHPASPHVAYVNYAPPFQAPLPHDTPDELYDALAAFAGLLAPDPFAHALQEGEAVVFDNRRIVHARTAFHATAAADGEPSRWLKGCYLEEDDVLDLQRVLSKRAEGNK